MELGIPLFGRIPNFPTFEVPGKPIPSCRPYDELCPARGVVVVVNVRGTRGDHLLCVCGLLVAAVAVPLRRL